MLKTSYTPTSLLKTSIHFCHFFIRQCPRFQMLICNHGKELTWKIPIEFQSSCNKISSSLSPIVHQKRQGLAYSPYRHGENKEYFAMKQLSTHQMTPPTHTHEIASHLSLRNKFSQDRTLILMLLSLVPFCKSINFIRKSVSKLDISYNTGESWWEKNSKTWLNKLMFLIVQSKYIYIFI